MAGKVLQVGLASLGEGDDQLPTGGQGGQVRRAKVVSEGLPRGLGFESQGEDALDGGGEVASVEQAAEGGQERDGTAAGRAKEAFNPDEEGLSLVPKVTGIAAITDEAAVSGTVGTDRATGEGQVGNSC